MYQSGYLTRDVLAAVVLVGDPGVGKTNLLATFLASDDAALLNADGVVKTFSPTKKPTIGVEFGTKIIHHPNGTRIKAQIWDTGRNLHALLSLLGAHTVALLGRVL